MHCGKHPGHFISLLLSSPINTCTCTRRSNLEFVFCNSKEMQDFSWSSRRKTAWRKTTAAHKNDELAWYCWTFKPLVVYFKALINLKTFLIFCMTHWIHMGWAGAPLSPIMEGVESNELRWWEQQKTTLPAMRSSHLHSSSSSSSSERSFSGAGRDKRGGLDWNYPL